MNLVLDFGNTCIKCALYEDGHLRTKKIFSGVEELLREHALLHSAQHCIIGSVTDAHIQFVEHANLKHVLLFSSTTRIPLENKYKSAATLGSDRLAAAVGAFNLYPNKNVLTVDAGTCIKYNFVNASNQYLGGAISPGIEMRFKSLHAYTAKLPLLQADFNYEKLTGNNTEESIMSGVLVGAAAEADEMISRYRAAYGDVTVVVSGGHAPYLCKQVKNPIFAHPDIVLNGLNSILNYNLEK